ncbi:MAG: hypothetical protein INF43_02285 [Alphaproteobacteria bacterium]|nr:hypothetical protein [Alphaproteobacteria bacterium]
MQRLSPSLFLGFLVNAITNEHFIAAAEAGSPTEATAKLRETYPSAAYHVLTVYQAQAVVKYLAEVQRWPGLPSKVQPSLTDLLATQRIRTQVGGLPPLRKEPAAAAQNPFFTATQLQQIQTIAQGMPAETQALAARLLAGNPKPATPQAPTMAPAAAITRSPLPAMPRQAAPQPAPAPVTARVEVSTTPAPKGGSLKEALAAMRAFNNSGQPSVFSQPLSKAAAPAPKPVAPAPSALPASARGVAAAEPTPASSPFAVGQVSAISVLKALRAGR